LPLLSVLLLSPLLQRIASPLVLPVWLFPLLLLFVPFLGSAFVAVSVTAVPPLLWLVGLIDQRS